MTAIPKSHCSTWDAEAIASAFGVTVAHVKGRLKLANLPNAALDVLKAKTINLSAAQKMKIAGPCEEHWKHWRPLLEDHDLKDHDHLLGPGAFYKMALTCKALQGLVHARDGILWRRFTKAVQNRAKQAGYTPGDLVSVRRSRAVVVQELPDASCPALGTRVRTKGRPEDDEVSARFAESEPVGEAPFGGETFAGVVSSYGYGSILISYDDGFKREFDSFFKAKLHFVALVNQQIAMER